MLPLPLAGAYDYRVPEDLTVIPGDFVNVPLGKQTRVGIVWDPAAKGDSTGVKAVDDSQLRDIKARLDTWRMGDSMRRLVDWLAAYSMSAPGTVLRMAMSIPEALLPGRPRIVYRLSATPPDFRATPARQQVIDVLRDGPARGSTDLAREAAVSIGVVRGMADLGVLDAVEISDDAPLPQPNPEVAGPDLSPTQ